jgi:CNT family concentrative nucleoside transporter
MDVLRSLVGVVLLIGIGVLISTNRKAINPRTVAAALAVQLAIGAFVLFVPIGRDVLHAMANGVNYVLKFGNNGIEFLFGGLVSDTMFKVFGGGGFVFALRVLAIIIYVTALLAVLYHLGIMRWIINALGFIFQRLLGVSKVESFCAVTTIFLGQSEMPAVVKPFVRKLTQSELFAIMCSGMASVAGSVLAGYAGLGVKMEYLLAASFMAIPGGLLFAKLIVPSTQTSSIQFDNLSLEDKRPANVIEAAAGGASVGMKIAVNVGAMLLAFIGLIALLNGLVGSVAGALGFAKVNLETLLGYAFAPIAYLIGVSWEHAAVAGNFLGQKLILNEFVAYIGLSPYLKEPAAVAAAGLTVLDPRTIAILSFALCGFANFTSIAILAGAFGSIDPDLRGEVAKLGLRVVAAGTLSNLMSATIAGIFMGLS